MEVDELSTNNDMDQATDKAMQDAAGMAKKAGKGVGKIGGKAGKKAAKAMIKAGIKAVKMLAALITKIIVFAWPVLLVAAGVLLSIVLIDHFMDEIRGYSQDYDWNAETYNKYQAVKNEYGDSELLTLSEENAFLQVLYEEESKNSYWKYYEKDGDSNLDYGTNRQPFSKEVKDKYNREQYFLLTAMNLYAIEEYLHNNVIYSPQTFVQHVPFEKGEDGRLEGIPLLDEDGKLNVESHKYEEHGVDEDGGTVYRKVYTEDNEPVFTKGIWDYGLAPVYHYKMFTEEYETRNTVTGAQIWDIDKQKFRPMTSSELSEFQNEGKPEAYEEYEDEYDKGEQDGKPNQDFSNIEIIEEKSEQDVWMIQDAVTPMGTIKNEIEQNWEQTRNITNSTQTITMNVPVEHTRKVQKEDSDGNPLWYELDWQGRYVRHDSVLNRSGMMGGPQIDYGNGNYRPIQQPPRRNPSGSTTSNSGITHPDRTEPIRDKKEPIRDRTEPVSRSYYGWGMNPSTSEFEGYSLPKDPNLKIPDGYNEGQVIKSNAEDEENAPPGWGIHWKWRGTKNETTKDTGDQYKVMVDEIYYLMEPKEHVVELTGYDWEYVPKYVGEPDTSELTGLDYYQQYFENYRNYVTEDRYPRGKIDEMDIELPPTPTDEDGNPLHEEDTWLDSFDATTPSEMLQLAKLDELRNLKYYHDPLGGAVVPGVGNTGTVKGIYDIPLTVEERLDGERTGLFHKEHPVMKAVRDKQVEHALRTQGSGISLNLDDVNFAEESNSEVVQKASEYLDLFVKYGEMYGVDPMLLLAISGQETGGSHYATDGQAQTQGVRRGYTYEGRGLSDAAAVGLMQIMPLHNGNVNRKRMVTAFNHQTQANETWGATVQELLDVENNIKMAAMILANEVAYAEGDILVGLSSYQFGAAYTKFVRDNGYGSWSPEADKAYLDSGRAGDLNYIPSVLRYYLPTEEAPFPWAINRDGEKLSYDSGGDINFASDELVNLEVTQSVSGRRRSSSKANNPVVDFFTDVGRTAVSAGAWVVRGVKILGNVFGITNHPDVDTSNYYKIDHNLNASDARQLIHTMMSYEEGLYLSEYENMTEEEFEDRFLKLFVSDVMKQQNLGMIVNPNDFFQDGYQSPVDNVDITVAYNEDHGSKSFHGIQLAVPGGAEVYVVADGTISSLSKNELEVHHGNEVYTSYRFVGDMKLKAAGYRVGDEVEKGLLIGRGSKDNGYGNFTKEGSFAFALRNPVQVDPTWIVDPSAIGGYGDLGIDPNSGTFQNPYYGKTYTFTSEYSHSRLSPTRKVYMPHVGTDMAGTGSYLKVHTELGAVADGVVTENRYQGTHDSGFGWYVAIRHDDVEVSGGGTMWSLYAHLAEQSPLPVGTKVRRGQAVGKEGTTGGSTGEHLHLEFIYGHGSSALSVRNADKTGNTVDPRPHIE